MQKRRTSPFPLPHHICKPMQRRRYYAPLQPRHYSHCNHCNHHSHSTSILALSSSRRSTPPHRQSFQFHNTSPPLHLATSPLLSRPRQNQNRKALQIQTSNARSANPSDQRDGEK
ncbi:hypothetical protein M758_1G068100 [Ceratodon purpureus]|uniref:Uncharacterized protein n=1 Tax=Ceratodon purpureus TaxID=3225 RepID=A0A8T0J3E7_CERPU|nr:hypothetical protein KC19_1G069500 [Ceratodon purpureus]KAG0628987.1 hypothetical protein M758_1G068100 [Ceratodon purpureus]